MKQNRKKAALQPRHSVRNGLLVSADITDITHISQIQPSRVKQKAHIKIFTYVCQVLTNGEDFVINVVKLEAEVTFPHNVHEDFEL